MFNIAFQRTGDVRRRHLLINMFIQSTQEDGLQGAFRTAYLCFLTPSYRSGAAHTDQCFSVMYFIVHSAHHVQNGPQRERVHISELGSRLGSNTVRAK